MNALHINLTFDLVALAARDTRLKRQGAYHVGPCPFCGGRDRFTVKRTARGDCWHCRKCAPGGYHSPIDYVMRRDGLNFTAALAQLQGADPTLVPLVRRDREAARPGLALPDADWRLAALREADAAADRLLNGDPIGRDYLARRGLHRETWLAWRLGLADVYDPSVGRRRPAIVIPWLVGSPDSATVTAVKYRFLNEPSGLRYTSRRGSVAILFGLWSIVPQHHTLMLVEGELNALSVWQCAPEGVICLSFGSETGARPLVLSRVARSFRRVLVWADDARRSRQIQIALGGRPQVFQSPEDAGFQPAPTYSKVLAHFQGGHESAARGPKRDANRLLQDGLLRGLLERRLGVRCERRYQVRATRSAHHT